MDTSTNEKQFINCQGELYEIESVIACMTSKEDFLKLAESTVINMQDRLKAEKDFRIFIIGTVNERDIFNIILTKRAGTEFFRINNKKEEEKKHE